MDPKDLNPISLSFLGDAIYSLKIREYYIRCGYRQGNVLQQLSKRYVSAEGRQQLSEDALEKMAECYEKLKAGEIVPASQSDFQGLK